MQIKSKRVILSGLAIVLLCSSMGIGVGVLVTSHRENTETDTSEVTETVTDKVTDTVTEPETTTSEIETTAETTLYGHYDEIYAEEIIIDWNAGDLDFTPLNVALDEELQEFIYYLAAGYNIDFTFVMALIKQESDYVIDVISDTNDYGLMQINVCNHEWLAELLGITDYLDPYQNIRAGMFILRKLFEQYDDVSLVLMVYNMGEDGASILWEQGVYETNYSTSILAIQQSFIAELNANEAEE